MLKDRIKEVRKSVKLNQSDFGAKIGVKGNTVGNYELGLRSPSDAIIFSICREFGISEVWLRTGEGEMYLPKSRSEQLISFFSDILKMDDDDFIRSFCTALASMDKDQPHQLANLSESVLTKWAQLKEKRETEQKEKADP